MIFAQSSFITTITITDSLTLVNFIAQILYIVHVERVIKRQAEQQKIRLMLLQLFLIKLKKKKGKKLKQCTYC